MCNVWFLILFFISCFSCIICALLCALCVSKENLDNSNASVVFCGEISAGRYSTKNSTWHEWSPAPDTGTSTNHVAAGFTPAGSSARAPDRGRGSGSMASPEKIARGHKKASLTKAIGALRRSIAEKDTGKVNSNLTKIKTVFSVFAEANDVYDNTLDDEDAILASEAYFTEAEQGYINAVLDANKWLSDQLKPADPPKSTADAAASTSTTGNMYDLLSLPKVTLEPFSGDPLRYNEFMALFDEMVDMKKVEDHVKLSRLLQFTCNDAKNAIRHCSLAGANGYQHTRRILAARFGNEYVISQRVVDNLKYGKPITNADGLQQLANDLDMAVGTLKELKLSSEVENQRSIVEIVQRCPKYVRDKWRDKALDHKEDKGGYPKFDEFVKFVKRMATKSIDPVYGSGAFKPAKYEKGNSSCNIDVGSNDCSGFNNSRSSSSGNDGNGTKCVVCHQQHRLFRCESFKAMHPNARLEVVKRNKLCYLCFYPHMVKDCKMKFRCTVSGCGRRHSKFIHTDEVSPRVVPAPATSVSSDPIAPTAPASIGNANVSGMSVYMPIVPVKVNNNAKTVYALLDSGSTNTFVTSSLSSELGLQESVTSYNISTIQATSTISKMVSFHLRSIDGDNAIGLSNVLVTPHIPAQRPGNLVDVMSYPHLSGLPLDCGRVDRVDIIIGCDNAHLLTPYEVRREPSGKNEPYATRSYFGWALCGPVPGTGNQAFSHFVQGSLEQQIENLWQVELGDSGEHAMSPLDQKVVDLWERETILEGNHYTIPIPWKQGRPCLPNNQCVTRHRLHSLQKRLESKGLTEK